MRFSFLPLAFTLLLIGYILYRLVVKKDLKSKMRTVVLPGLFFIAVWVLIYYFTLI
jgi:membrane protein CcdC involved in cytochrome C biogenesis